MNQSDISLTSRTMDQLLDRHGFAVAAAREQSLRDLARPYLRSGYLPSELTAVERQSRWFATGETTFSAVWISHKQPTWRLFGRRLLMRLHLRRRPHYLGGVCIGKDE